MGLIDVAFFLDSVKKFSECKNFGTGLNLALDFISLAPIIPSLGYITRADDVYDTFKGFGKHKSTQKWMNQLEKRGWTPGQVDQAIKKGKNFPAKNNINPGNSATRYVHPETGKSVVIDNVTKEVIHVGGEGFKY